MVEGDEGDARGVHGGFVEVDLGGGAKAVAVGVGGWGVYDVRVPVQG